MPVAAYYTWDRLGRPLTPAQHIREFVDKMKAAYPAAARQNLFGWYADEAHYAAVPAEDHTPFSQTGWPGVSPQWWVFATDVMHRPDLGVDCDVLFEYWIGEARAGRMPWLKYLIWQAKLYDVRNGWLPVGNSDHYDHIHLSGRTDFVNAGLGTWSPVPGTAPEEAHQPEEDDMVQVLIQPTNGAGIAITWPSDQAGGWVYTNIIPPGSHSDRPEFAPEVVAQYLAAGVIDGRGWNIPSFDGYIPLSSVSGSGGSGPSLAQLEAAAFEGAQRAEKE